MSHEEDVRQLWTLLSENGEYAPMPGANLRP
ncbi:hypothetical protein SAMN05216598_0574 [Pseudomonas asplenii]|uniref:Uncharacterized protein n=1 Tax=Pseudomonas asplenii TaxID=53407 RepID=A0A1H1PLD9_9PSED|nr:hypothetical protein SAMN05216598_0574 [Pseudomonas asplenii]